MKKTITRLLLVFSMIASISLPTLAATYSDLTGHWAESYMTKLSDLGYLNGYADGSIKPDANISAVECLALLSRFYTAQEPVVDLIHDDFGAFVAQSVEPSLNWAYDELELCLAAGIISEKEMVGLKLKGTMNKETLSVFLARALQLTEEALELENTAMDFVDVKDINENCYGSVAVLVNAKILEGNSKNEFSPHLAVSRSVVSTMVVRGLEFIEEQGDELLLLDYQIYDKHEGIITQVSSTSLTVRDVYNVIRKYTISPDATITQNGKTIKLASLGVGSFATVSVDEGQVVAVATTREEGANWTQGLLNSTSSSRGQTVFNVTQAEDGLSKRYTTSDQVVYYLNGEEIPASKVRKDTFATIKFLKNIPVQVHLYDADYSVSGTIETLQYTPTVAFNIRDEDGFLRIIPLDIENPPKIMRGETESNIERLNVGEQITVNVVDAEITTIDTSGSTSKISGTLESIIETTNGKTWIIIDEFGDQHTFLLDANAKAYYGSKSIQVADITAGDSVEVETHGTSITAITLESSLTESSTKITGIVISVDTKTKTVSVATSPQTLVYVKMDSSSTIISNLESGTISLSALDVGNQIVAYGSTVGNGFLCTSMIVEG